MPFFKHFLRKRIYLDYASSTPVDRQMMRGIPKIPATILAANPSALHQEGVALRNYIEQARLRCAQVLEVHGDEIFFTSGATESDNLAIVGTVYAWMQEGIKGNEIAIVTSELEHAAITESTTRLMQSGVRSIILPTREGVVDPKDISIPQGVRAVFISVMYVNNEIGTVQPVIEIAKRVRKLRKEFPEISFVFHTDATQAPTYFSLRVPTLGVDMMTLGATKLYCTKGVGLLYKKRNSAVAPLFLGGGQEGGLRPGTEPAQLIHEFSHALSFAQGVREQEMQRIGMLQKYFETQIKNFFPKLSVTAHTSLRSPHITHLGVPNFDSELLVIELDARGIAISAKSACKNEEGSESPIIKALYGKGWGGIRFSFGRATKKKDIDRAVDALKAVLNKYY